jgi:small basic protein
MSFGYAVSRLHNRKGNQVMTDDKLQAYSLAKEAAALDFGSAVQGLIAGHADKIKEMEKLVSKYDKSFLMALCLTEKGARLDKDGNMARIIADGLKASGNNSPVEKRFIDLHERKPK